MKKIQSIFTFKCPQCLKGDFYESNKFYNFNKLGKVKDCCSHCGLKYTKETGFYYGAMYVSYALGVALMVSIFVAVSVLYPSNSTGFMIGSLVIGMLLMFPVLYALSKIIWINFFESYSKEAASQKKVTS
jgi:uncharacterized protein (DUF983 family)